MLNARRGVVRQMLAVVIFLLAVPASLLAAERFVDSSDYKDKDFRKGIIADYSKLRKGDDIEWVWVDPARKISQYRIKVGQMQNKSDERSKSMAASVRQIFEATFQDYDAAGDRGTLTADLCIYEVQQFSPGKAWIPFAGGHQMQAGIGVEMVLTEGGKPVAAVRHFAREGAQVEAAAQEVANDFVKFIRQN